MRIVDFHLVLKYLSGVGRHNEITILLILRSWSTQCIKCCLLLMDGSG